MGLRAVASGCGHRCGRRFRRPREGNDLCFTALRPCLSPLLQYRHQPQRRPAFKKQRVNSPALTGLAQEIKAHKVARFQPCMCVILPRDVKDRVFLILTPNDRISVRLAAPNHYAYHFCPLCYSIQF